MYWNKEGKNKYLFYVLYFLPNEFYGKKDTVQLRCVVYVRVNKDIRFSGRISIQIAILSLRHLNLMKEEEILLIWEMASDYAYCV